MTRLPRIVIGAPASGHGKTTIAIGLMAALRNAGLVVSGHKVGPDYIDPGYHSLATGRPGRNLDPHLVGEHRLVPLLLHGAAAPDQADIAVIEGVMGLFDGAIGREGFASTAHVAGLVKAPVVLVVDISSASRTNAAVVHGLATFEPGVRIAGVILNKGGSARHSREVTSALEATGIPVLGVLDRDVGVTAPSRHLGLVPAPERDDARAALGRLAEQVAGAIDLDEVVRIARGAVDLPSTPWDPTAEMAALGLPAVAATSEASSTAAANRPVVAVAGGRAFTFRYAEIDELLRAAGLDPVVFDPIADEALPPGTQGLYLGGGFPEVHAAGLSANAAMREALRAAINAGVPTVAECAGLLYLCESVDGSAMVGALPAHARMTPRLTLSYRSAISPADSLLAPAGFRSTGHEFHRSTVEPVAGTAPAWLLDGVPAGFSEDPAGTGSPTLHASYLHSHWAGYPELAARFARAVNAFAGEMPTPGPHPGACTGAGGEPLAQPPDIDLHHHGDAEIGEHLVDLAVNVRLTEPPGWLATRIADTVGDLARYPRPAAALEAISARHQRPIAQVLPTSGGAEAFTLLARAMHPKKAVVVHPQFTGPEAALVAAGHPVHRVILSAADGFTLHAAAIPEDADLVMIGNPTNPTGTLHASGVVRALVRPGRTVVVDEAFMDAVPRESESLADVVVPGLVVLRSLTKTWGIAGLRAGYAVGDETVIAAMRSQQPPWSVSTPALAAIVACLEPAAIAEAAAATSLIADHRQVLLDGLAELGLPVAGRPGTPFVLLDTGRVGTDGSVRNDLRDRGFAVRRGDTFPGLGPDWIRIAVREPAVTRRLLEALAVLLARTPAPVAAETAAEIAAPTAAPTAAEVVA
ncbi:cobyrinate a,c-diamide synthase [Nakamurella sp. UYEF19]|uniref:cobyrinate a,c-diamide synthase n=1 Tax=Nakamurella sp. UYEF19 TaxID=1756392 RepID=UPI00339A4E87